VYVHTYLTAISALPGGFICTVTAKSFLAGMELRMVGSSTQVVAAAPICAAPVFQALSSGSVEIHVLVCAVNSGAAG